jgi:hypothetical protein
VSEPEGDDIVWLTNSWVAPDACTLPTTEQPLRAAEFDTLFANHLAGVDRVSSTQLQLTLTGPAGLADHVTELTDRESSCCSFFTFTVSASGSVDEDTQVRLDVEVPPARIDILEALAGRARLPVRRG